MRVVPYDVIPRKYGRSLTQLLHDELHWLDVALADRVTYKLSLMACNYMGSQGLQAGPGIFTDRAGPLYGHPKNTPTLKSRQATFRSLISSSFRETFIVILMT